MSDDARMNMSTWAIRNPVPPVAAFLVLVVVGLFAFRGMPVTQFPNIDVPIITVTVGQPGAAPSELIAQVTQPIEDSISSITGVKHITSVATDSSSETTVEFELSTDSDRALNDVKDAVTRARASLPDSITEPLVQRLDITGSTIMTYAVSDPSRTIEDLSYFVDDVMSRELQGVDGLGKIERLGGADREIKVELDGQRLLAFGISAAQVSRQLSATNIDQGAGRGDLGGQELSIRTLGGATTLDQLAATPLALADGRTIRLSDVGEVIDGPSEARAFATLDGQPVVAFGVFRATGASDLTVAEGVREKLEEVRAAYPGVEVTLIDDTTTYTEGSYHSAMETLYEGAALAIIVVFLFLKNWRATLITAVALPLSIIPTFFVMDMLGFSLNTVSLLGITLVTGILVDDAIVEIENIVRHIHMGKPAYEATEEAAGEIGLTVIAISFTIVAVFAPVSFMPGIAGQYFKQFGLTVAVAVLFSLLVARLITPLMAAYILRDAPNHVEEKDGFVMRGYMRVLGWTLRHRLITMVLGLGIFAGSIYSATLLATEFIPEADEGRLRVAVELPPGATLDETRALTNLITARAQDIPEVVNVLVQGGTGGNVAKATVNVTLGDKGDRARSQFEVEDELTALLADLPDARVNMLAANGQRAVNVAVLGDDLDTVTAAAQQLTTQMSGVPEIRNVTNAASLARPELRITPYPQIAAELGITASDLASTIRVLTIGDDDVNLAKFSIDGRQIPIVVRIAEDNRRNLDLLASQRIPTASGTAVPLSVVADVTLANGPSSIERYDRETRITLQADLSDGVVLGQATGAIFALPGAGPELPPGVRVQPTGDAEVQAEVFTAFGSAMGAGILLVYVVLVLLFGSFVTPFTILMSLPLAIGGAILALYLTGSAIGLSVVIGFLMLMGIVTKNAIMLVEFALEAMKRGDSRTEAMLDAGHKRARPIVMTTIAMAAGMVPSALAFGAGGEFRSPMAVAVIGGLLLSTLLSLIFIPSLFSVIEGGRGRSVRVLLRGLKVNRPLNQPAE
ncbi:hydrophobe/amphiphile efflux-1 (HAE1) family protein [Loktanella fryxellensis]|uniref:Hydrophobe/amphiphile efflux-1 (HAE1) family protein n=1 Tax=Loktanella fryxellensis TaxID=245187 RepID=A0A1H7ZAF2_9RHOB|nr:efflux RND transporter permease subunit [Loktanella fryxellensis]SEM54449.1 hydrophobe/amphiphile efflux-1 (HAE1) family protein [Loktanella fryxellensis]